MSVGKNKLLDWVDDQLQLPSPVKYVLDKLARFADANGESWAKVDELARVTNCDVRSVQNHLKRLKADGLIVDTGRKHRLPKSTRSVPLYQMAPELFGAATPADSMGENLSPIETAWVKDPASMGENCFTRIEPIEPTLSDESGAGARAQAVIQEFEVIAALWIAAAPARFARVPAWAAWQAVCERHDPADLVRAARRYLVEGVKVDGGRVKALARWLSDGWFEGFLGEGPARSGGASGAGGVFADATIRKTVVTLKGEDFASSYLDRASWDAGTRTITARTSIAAERLRTLNSNPVWPKLAITVRDPEPALSEGGR